MKRIYSRRRYLKGVGELGKCNGLSGEI